MTPATIQNAGKAIAPVQHVCQIVEQQTTRYQHSDHCTAPKFGKDFKTVLSVLENEQVFVHRGQRKHLSYKFNTTLMEKHSKEDIERKK